MPEEDVSQLGFIKTDDVFADVHEIIEHAQKYAYQAVNTTLVRRNWLIGKRIAEEELKGEKRAEYGAEIIKKLAKDPTDSYGKGFTKTNLYSFYSFYATFPEIFHSASGIFTSLSWTHYRVLLQVADSCAREWYAKESASENWSVRTLQRNVSSQYYYRILQSQKPDAVKSEIVSKYSDDKFEFIKNPVVAEFLGFSLDSDFSESELEHSIEQLFASKYKLYLPTEEELRREIEMQKEMFYLQQSEKGC